MTVTIFTPTYNRAYILPNLYASLQKQTCTDFEWLIIDDGSTDNTEEIVKPWLEETSFLIRYIKQKNGGKHRAINRGVQEARGELFFIVDSDDILPEYSICRITYHFASIRDKKTIGGLCGLKAYYDGTTVGGPQNFGVVDCTNFDIDYKYNVKGDMAEVFRTDVMKEFPFPDIEGERFCPEILIWNRISTKYIIRYFSENIYLCEYLEGGLTSKITRIRMQSPFASCMTYFDMVHAPIPLWAKIRASINFWRFYYCKQNNEIKLLSPFWYITRPIGWLMHIKDLNNEK